ncbi:G-protein coupled receptor 54-like [Patiria miniata]|uniref:G-protein coupled receptors family 1 profile domain-containing protein n=1 Tax=Patiria miniata TaxID=46514 RepID=A0A913YYL5_PATMI|nr:G-protein coupled receptor 54-like [Patiria miniata]
MATASASSTTAQILGFFLSSTLTPLDTELTPSDSPPYLPANTTSSLAPRFPDIITEASESGPVQQATAGRAAWLIPVIFGLITVCGVVGNSLVIYVIVRHGHMKTVTNYYIVNLAVTDISFLLCCAPFTATLFVSPNWLFGTFMCKFVFYMMQVTGQCTCLTLTAMSIDRYQAIVHPIRSLKSRTTRVACIVNACIWIGSFLISIPVPIFFDLSLQPGDVWVCLELWPLQIMYPGYVVFCFILLYVIPIFTISVCYSLMLRKLWTRVSPGETADPNSGLHNARQKRKVTRMVLVVVLVFAVCWLPIHVITLWMRLDPAFPRTDPTYIFKMAAHTLSYANSMVNPFVYAFMGENYRRYFKKAFPVCFGQKRRRQAGDPTSRTDQNANFTGATSAAAVRTVETVALD